MHCRTMGFQFRLLRGFAVNIKLIVSSIISSSTVLQYKYKACFCHESKLPIIKSSDHWFQYEPPTMKFFMFMAGPNCIYFCVCSLPGVEFFGCQCYMGPSEDQRPTIATVDYTTTYRICCEFSFETVCWAKKKLPSACICIDDVVSHLCLGMDTMIHSPKFSIENLRDVLSSVSWCNIQILRDVCEFKHVYL